MATLHIRDRDDLFALPALAQSRRPDWVDFDYNLLSNAVAAPRLAEILAVSYPYLGKGFECSNNWDNVAAQLSRLTFHRMVAAAGFMETQDLTRYVKPYAATTAFNFDYLGDFPISQSIADLQPHPIYNRVLGGDLSLIPGCLYSLPKVDTWIELMSGTALAALAINRACPQIRDIHLVDLDITAFAYSAKYPWYNVARYTHHGDVLERTTFLQLEAARRGDRDRSVNFIGKSSISLFNRAQLLRLLDSCTRLSRYTLLELSGLANPAEDAEHDLTPAMLRHFHGSVLEKVHAVEPILGRSKLHLLARGWAEQERALIKYEPWYHWTPTDIARLAEQRGWAVTWLHPEQNVLLPLNECDNASWIDYGQNTLCLEAQPR